MLFRVETTQETSKDIKSLNKKFLELFYFLDQQPNRQTKLIQESGIDVLKQWLDIEQTKIMK